MTMSLRVTIHATLLADAAVAALIGEGLACRHYPERAPQNPPWPCVISSHIASDAKDTHGQPDDAEDTLDETLVQFNCLAATLAEAIALRSAVRAAFMNDLSGVLETAKITVTGPQERTESDDQLNAYNAQLDLTFFHNPQT